MGNYKNWWKLWKIASRLLGVLKYLTALIKRASIRLKPTGSHGNCWKRKEQNGCKPLPNKVMKFELISLTVKKYETKPPLYMRSKRKCTTVDSTVHRRSSRILIGCWKQPKLWRMEIRNPEERNPTQGKNDHLWVLGKWSLILYLSNELLVCVARSDKSIEYGAKTGNLRHIN